MACHYNIMLIYFAFLETFCSVNSIIIIQQVNEPFSRIAPSCLFFRVVLSAYKRDSTLVDFVYHPDSDHFILFQTVLDITLLLGQLPMYYSNSHLSWSLCPSSPCPLSLTWAAFCILRLCQMRKEPTVTSILLSTILLVVLLPVLLLQCWRRA